MKKIIILTTATALLSSCGIYTKYQPAETTPDNLYGEEVAVDDTTNFGNVNWRELFTDPQLQALIEQGLQNNTDLRSAQLQIEERSAVSTEGKRLKHTRCLSQPVGNWTFSDVCAMPSNRPKRCMPKARTTSRPCVPS